MIPRLTKYGRMAEAKYGYKSRKQGVSTGSCRPSPAERLRQRRKARAEAQRWLNGYETSLARRLLPAFRAEDYDRHEAMIGMDDDFPQSRGTTTGQLVAMHLEAEE